MKSFMTGSMLAAVCAIGMSAAQQTTTTGAQESGGGSVSLTGCLLRGPEGQFHLADAVPDHNTAADLPPVGLTWSLTGDADIAAHAGQRVQVTGQSEWDGVLALKAGPSAGRADVPLSPQSQAVVVERDSGVTSLSESAFQMQVSSVQPLDDSCA